MGQKVKRFGLVVGLLAGFFGGLAEPVQAAAGLAGVREAVGLLVDNQIRARKLMNAHQTAIQEGKGDVFQSEQLERILQGNAQLVVTLRVLNDKPQTTPVAEQLKGEEIARRMYDINRQTIALVLSPLDKAGIEKRRKDFQALDDRFDAEVENLPELVSEYALGFGNRRDAVLEHHRQAIIAEMTRAASGRGGGAGFAPEPMDPAEYQRKVQALEDKKAADARYHALRMKEIEEHDQQQEAERLKAEAAKPKTPPPPPPDLAQIQAWHKGYSVKIQPFKKALGKVLALDRSRQSKDLALACGELGTVTQQLMTDRAMISRSLELNGIFDKVLRLYKTASADCYAGDLVKLDAGLKQGEAALGQMAAWLQPYSLSL